MLTCSKMEVFTLLSVIVVYFGELNINCEAKALDKPVTEEGMAFTDFNRLQINSLAYPDDDYPTTLTPAEDTTSASVENIGDLTSTEFYPPDEDDDIMSTINKENDSIGKKIVGDDDDDDDDEAERVEDQQRVLIIFTQSTTAVLITFISCFILICVLFCCVFLCIAMAKPPRPSNMSIAVPPNNNNLPVAKISSYSSSSTNFDKNLDYKF